MRLDQIGPHDERPAGVWEQLQQELLRRLRSANRIDFSRVCVGSSSIPAKKGPATGPNPTDRGKPGTKRHLVTDRSGIPRAVQLAGASIHDSTMLQDRLDAIPPIGGKPGRPQRRPGTYHADKGYDDPRCREACRHRGIPARIARKGIDSKGKRGRQRWVVEPAIAWLNRHRCLTIRYERLADIHQELPNLACSLITLRALYQRF